MRRKGVEEEGRKEEEEKFKKGENYRIKKIAEE